MAAIEEALRAKKDLVEAGCLGAGMSGSGSAAYGLAESEGAAKAIASRLGVRWPWVAVARTVPAGESPTVAEVEMI